MRTKEEKAIKALIKMNGWTKDGGKADAKLKAIEKLLRDANFKRFKEKDTHFSIPDGSSVGGYTAYQHPLGLVAKVYEKYGSTKWDNYYMFSIQVKEGK